MAETIGSPPVRGQSTKNGSPGMLKRKSSPKSQKIIRLFFIETYNILYYVHMTVKNLIYFPLFYLSLKMDILENEHFI